MLRRQALTGGFLCAWMSAVLLAPAFAADDKAATAQPKGAPSATLDVASKEMRLIYGGTAGKGVLHFNGQDYPFSYKSASLGVGAKAVKNMSATGNVYGLTRIEDFAGEYTSVSQSTMAGAATSKATYKNDKGVSLELSAKMEGVGLSMGGGMATVTMLKK